MAIGDDFSVAVNGDIRYTGASTNYTVIQFHRWLQDLADDAVAVGNDLLDITDNTPSDRSTDNIITLNGTYNIDDAAAQHLYDGSITQGTGTTETQYSGLVVLGSVETGTQLIIIQDGALLTSYWGTGLNTDPAANILLRIMVKTRDFGANIDGKKIIVQARELGDTYAEFSATLGLGNSVAAISTASDLNNQTVAGTIAGWTIAHTEGYQLLDLVGDGSANEPYYGKWDHTTGSGNGIANDIYEYTKYIQRRATAETIYGVNGSLMRGITHDITYDTLTGAFTENNYLVWGTEVAYDTGLTTSGTVGAYYTFSLSGAVGQLLAIDDTAGTGFAIFAIEPGSGTVVDNDVVTRVDLTAADGHTVNVTVTDPTAVGGRGLILADEGSTRAFIQLDKGSAPVDNLPIFDASSAGVYNTANNTALVNVTITSRSISPEFIGNSTGSAIIGAYGIAFVAADTTASDLFFDLNNASVTPPNNVTFTVSGIVSGEDRVLVTNDSGGGINVSQLSLSTILNANNETAVVVTEAPPANTPSTGNIRVVDDAGVHRRLHYTAFSGAGPTTFTIDTVDGNEDFLGNEAAVTNDVYLAYIDEIASGTTATYTTVFTAGQTLFVRVRDGGTAGDLTPIKTFETTASLGSGGGGATAIRTSDA